MEDMHTRLLLAAGCASLCLAQTPLRVITTPAKPQSISFISVRLQDLRFGREGPSYFSSDRNPVRGKQEIVELSLHGQEAIRSVRFDLAGDAGQPLGAPVAFRTGDGSDAYEYLLLMNVPSQPFRIRASGDDIGGQRFERTYRRLFVPANTEAPAQALPAELEPVAQRMMQEYAAQVRAQFDAAQRRYPDGVIRLARAEVVQSNYEALRSPVGNEIGMRLRIAVRFGAEGDYSLSPHVFPLYQNADWRGDVTMKVLDAAVNPSPQNTAADTLDDVLRYGGAAHYQADRVYQFTFDLAPSYVIRNVSKTRFCVYTESYRAAGRLARWESILASTAPVKYRVDIPTLDFVSETADQPSQRTYYQNFLREGAQDCGPAPTNRF